jgi:cytochrome oxidase Cu insertion factor (SCO1/SenC/PrrC family)
MLRKTWIGLLVLVLASFLVNAAWAQGEGGQRRRRRRRREVVHPKVGEVLEDFTLKDVKGKDVKLSDFRNKIFVLELGACT